MNKLLKTLLLIGFFICPKAANAVELNENTINAIHQSVGISIVSFALVQMLKSYLKPVKKITKNSSNKVWNGNTIIREMENSFESDLRRIENIPDSNIEKVILPTEVVTQVNTAPFEICQMPTFVQEAEDRDDSHMNYLYQFESLYQ